MNNSNESGASTPRLFLTGNGAYFKSPIQLSSDQGIETPPKLPAAPHPSPINMDIESSNTKSKEVFRTELLKACQLKIPEAIAKASNFDDDVLANLSYTEEDALSNLADVPLMSSCTGQRRNKKLTKIFDYFPGAEKSNLLGQARRDFEQFSEVKDGRGRNSISDAIPKSEVYSSELNKGSRFIKESVGQCSRITYSTGNLFECLDDECSITTELPIFRHQFDPISKFEEDYSSDLNHYKRVGESPGPRITYSNENQLESPNGGKSAQIQFDVKPPSLNLNLLESMHRKDGASVFYDHATDHLEIVKLLEVKSSGWQETSICRSRSPCSDKMSTIAVCSSDASDISDGDLVDRDRSEDFDEKVQEDRRPPKKQQSKSSAMRRFLSWRRTLKFRKRTASLDESQFPFLANRFDSYKTEFELSV